jgi:hypothetical protein
MTLDTVLLAIEQRHALLGCDYLSPVHLRNLSQI